MTRSPRSVCPVPPEQQPLNEFSELKDAWLLSWPTLPGRGLATKLLWVWAWSWIVAGPVSAASFPLKKDLAHFLLGASGGAVIPTLLVLVHIYSAWRYVGRRLFSEKIIYEESGWYDGQVWEKAPEMLAQDRLVVSYEVTPTLDRLRRLGLILLGTLVAGAAVWGLV